MTDTPATTLEPVRVLLVYTGERVGEGGKPAHEWCDIGADGAIVGAGRWFTRNPVRGTYIGAVYEFRRPAGDDKQVYTAGKWAPGYKRPWGNRDDVLRWQVASRDAQALREAKRDKDKDAKMMNVVRATLLPLRRLYYGRPVLSRQAVLELVLAELSRPLTKVEREGGKYDDD